MCHHQCPRFCWVCINRWITWVERTSDGAGSTLSTPGTGGFSCWCDYSKSSELKSAYRSAKHIAPAPGRLAAIVVSAKFQHGRQTISLGQTTPDASDWSISAEKEKKGALRKWIVIPLMSKRKGSCLCWLPLLKACYFSGRTSGRESTF